MDTDFDSRIGEIFIEEAIDVACSGRLLKSIFGMEFCSGLVNNGRAVLVKIRAS